MPTALPLSDDEARLIQDIPCCGDCRYHKKGRCAKAKDQPVRLWWVGCFRWRGRIGFDPDLGCQGSGVQDCDRCRVFRCSDNSNPERPHEPNP
jgi:hypothetical protein